jgi:uncharacterized protein YndB with AHSA1/START domain
MSQTDETRRTIAYADGQQTLTLSRVYPTDAPDLWDACTNAERIPRWFLPIRGDLTVGGTYELEGNAHGTVETCDPPREFTATWEFGGDVSRIRVSIAPEGDAARFTLEHTGGTDSDHWREYGPAAVGIGWDGMLHGLGLHTESGQPVDPQLVAEWAGSEEGLAFTRASGDHWLAADLAAGTTPEDAERRAAATVRAYTGG